MPTSTCFALILQASKFSDIMIMRVFMEKVLLIIPAYNEEKNILNVFNSIKKYNKDNKTKYDVIVINDGSKDKTKEILKRNKIPSINLMDNLGIGGAVQTGFKYAYENNYDIAVQFDGDNQHDIKFVKNIIRPIIYKKFDCVIGSRFIGNLSKYKSTFLRRVGIKILSFEIRLLTRKKIKDPTSGFRAFNKKVIKYFSNDYPLEYPEPISTVMLLKNKFSVIEVPVKMKSRKNGISSIYSWRTVYYMINVILSIFIVSIKEKKI